MERPKESPDCLTYDEINRYERGEFQLSEENKKHLRKCFNCSGYIKSATASRTERYQAEHPGRCARFFRWLRSKLGNKETPE